VTDPSARPTRAQQRRRTEETILAAARQMFADVGYDRTTIRAVARTAGVDASLVMHYFGTKNGLFARAASLSADELPGGTARQAPSGTTHLRPGTADQAPLGTTHQTPNSTTHLPPAGTANQTPLSTTHQAPDSTTHPPPAGTADQVAGGTADQVAEALLTSLATRLNGEPVASLAVLRSMLTNADAADRCRAAGEPQLRQIAAAIPTADAELRAGLLGAIVHGVIIERYLLRFGRLADASPDQIIDLLRPCFRMLATAQTPPSAAGD
jgi:AcrR family transcriptional regulator